MARLFAYVLALVALVALTGCTRHTLVDVAMASAYRPPRAPRTQGPYVVLGGDMHCHVQPPDSPSHVARGLHETVGLAHEEGLDFVLLTPHVRARFFADPERRAAFVASQRELAAAIAREPLGDLLVVRGLEYTDFEEGHLTMGFADPEAVLDAVPLAVAQEHPAAFIDAWIERGGVVAINHPVLTPLASFPLRAARGDLSWRPFFGHGPFPPEIEEANRRAQGIEVFNLAVTHLRDGMLLGDRERSLRHASWLLQRKARLEGRRIAAIGGTDSHAHHLRAATWVLAEARTPTAIADAIRQGRTCVRSPEACTFEARAAGDAAFSPVGSSLQGTRIEVRGGQGPIVVLANGVVVARPAAGEIAALDVDRRVCAALYAQVGEGLSSPIYAGCAF